MSQDQDIRNLLNAVAGATSEPAGFADQLLSAVHADVAAEPRSLRRWAAPLLAAAAVVALVLGGVGLARQHHSSPPVTTGTPTPSPSPVVSTPAPTPSFPGFTATSVSYLDSGHAWALGDGPCPTGAKTDCATLLGTTSGGGTWTRLSVPAGVVSTEDSGSCGTNGYVLGPCVDNVVFATPKIGYLWSFHTLYMTTNGGRSWADLHALQVRSISIVGDTALRLLATHPCSSGCDYDLDAAPVGTNNWQTVTPGTPHSSSGTLVLSSGRTAYFVSGFYVFSGNTQTDAKQNLYSSTDGIHWTSRATNLCDGNEVVDVEPGPADVIDLVCGAAVGSDSRFVSVSADSGSTFSTEQRLPVATNSTRVSVAALSATRFVLSNDAGNGATYLSEDAGASWSLVDHVGTRQEVFTTARFVTPAIGYRESADGTFLSVTDDGGATWTHLQF